MSIKKILIEEEEILNNSFNKILIEEEEDASAVEQEELIEKLRDIDWQRFHNLCISIGKELNDPQWRFLKAIFLENAVAEYSNNVLTYVGDSEQGCDFIVKDMNNLKIEMKYVEECLYNKKLVLKNITKDIKLMNSNGTNTHTKLPDTYSDYLLIVDLNGAALVSKTILENYITIGGDGIKAKIPTNKLNIICDPNNIIQSNTKTDLHIKETIMNTIITIIQNNK
jgi:hypothetical protein